MDNVTHTLIGTLLGETAARGAPAASEPEARLRRVMFLSVMIVGSNIPDADLLYSLGSGDKLRYLLEHRGHTHTVIGALLASAVLLFGCWIWLRWRRTSLAPDDRTRLVALAVLAPLLHVAMDAFNSYGVHPWWPFDDRWLYGDSVFIVEPLFWACAAPLALLLESYVARGLIVVVLLGGLYLAFVTGIVAQGSILAYCALAATMLVVGWKASPRTALVAALATWLAITAAFSAAGRQVAARLDGYAAAHTPRWRTLDRVLTPMPMNPLCWDVILVQADGDRYVLRRAVASIVPYAQCPAGATSPTITAPLHEVELPETLFLHWRGQVDGSRDELRALAAASCRVAAFMRFARAPWLDADRDAHLVGDLRFDREPGLGFAELDLRRETDCPAYVPPWVPPRRDLLGR